MKYKFIIGILMAVVMFSFVSAFDYNEDVNGNPFLESEYNVKVPQINVRDLLILEPKTEPQVPELGMIYFDASEKRLKLYDGEGWYAIALEKVSTISKRQVVEKVEKKGEVQDCEESVDCGDWGDCINNYQTMTCVTIDNDCNKYEDIETRDCVSDFILESPAKGSHDVSVGETEEEVAVEPVVVEKEVEEVVEEEVSTTSEVETSTEEAPEESAPTTSDVPEELFDITFDLEESSLSNSDQLVLWSTLQNFGKKYVPARLVYVVYDFNGEEVYREYEEIRVYTDQSIIKRFDNLVLDDGDYVLSMRVEYAGIIEEFSDDFSVENGFFISIKRFFSGWF